MRRNKNEVYEMIFNDAKEVMLEIAGEYCYDVAMCTSLKQLKLIAQYDQVFYENAVVFLYNVKSFEEMEKTVSVMNVLFNNNDFKSIKDELYYCLISDLSIERYCVARHLTDKNVFDFVNELYRSGHADALSCAKYCMIEDDYEHAVYFLKELDECEDEAVLDLLASYSFREYLKLVYYYKKKAKGLILALG